jgi:hypothetical protein
VLVLLDDTCRGMRTVVASKRANAHEDVILFMMSESPKPSAPKMKADILVLAAQLMIKIVGRYRDMQTRSRTAQQAEEE